jgi:arylsulfatase A-like enzyme
MAGQEKHQTDRPNEYVRHVAPVHLAAIACFTGLIIGFFDVLVTLALNPSELVSSSTSLSLAAAVISVLVLYICLWLCVAYPASGVCRLSRLSLAISISIFLMTFNLAASVSGLITFTPSQYDITRLFIIAGGSGLISMGAYGCASRLVRSPRHLGCILAAGCIGSLVFAEGALFGWLVRSRMTLAVSISLAAAFVAFVALAIATIFALRKLPTKTATTLPFVLMLVVVVFLPFRALVRTGPPSTPVSVSGQSALPVKYVILIIVDTLRADFLSCLNDGAPRTPNMDMLADDGVLFSRAISSAPWTVPSVASIMTGLSPNVHQAMSARSRLPDELTTLAEYMQDAGYYTTAMGFNPFLRKRYNMHQGFYEYVFPKPPSRSRSLGGVVVNTFFPAILPSTASTTEITQMAIDWIERNKDVDFFLWTHYYDPHLPYAPPPEFEPDGEVPPRIGRSFSRIQDVRAGHFAPTLPERDWIRELYKSEVEYVDDSLGDLIQTLKRLDIYDEALIILTSDHGEEFWEHGSFEHGHSLHDELLWVPLILKLPRSSSAREVATAVSIESILPSVLDICQIDHVDQHLTGKSLMPLIDTGASYDEDQSIHSTGVLYYGQKESAIFGEYKYVLDVITGEEILYRIGADGQYQSPLESPSTEQLDRARSILAAHHSESSKLRDHYGVEAEEAPIEESVLRQLRALGYVR